MSQISTKQVIAYLNNRKRELEEKIHHIGNTITFLSGSRLQQPFISGQSGIDEPKISGLPHQGKTTRRLKAENAFNPGSKLDGKIAYVLTRIGSGFKDDIVAELHALQPELDSDKLEKAITVRLSYLLKIKAIQGRKISRRYEYSLLE